MSGSPSWRVCGQSCVVEHVVSTEETSMSDGEVRAGCCGCIVGFPFLVFVVLVFWTVFIGLSTPWGVLNIDLLPPAIRLDK